MRNIQPVGGFARERRGGHDGAVQPVSVCGCSGFPDPAGRVVNGLAAYQVAAAFVTLPKVLASGDFGYMIIDSIGYVVIAIAIIDVAKHLIEEEVMGRHDEASGFRENFPKFISIISIAIFLEGLVLVFKTTQDDIKLMVYPVLLLLVGVAMTVGLAIFQRFGAASSRGETTSR